MKKLKNFPYLRKSQGKTNYRRRLRLLISKLPRVVVRKSSKNLMVQLIEYYPDGDKVILSAHTRELEKSYNWPARGNLPSAYLLGLLFGMKMKSKNIKKAILDLGPFIPIKGSIKYAVLKGVVDSGVDVPHSVEALPNEARISGKHIADYSKKAKEKFSLYLKKGINPEELPKLFENTKNQILKGVANVSQKEKATRERRN